MLKQSGLHQIVDQQPLRQTTEKCTKPTEAAAVPIPVKEVSANGHQKYPSKRRAFEDEDAENSESDIGEADSHELPDTVLVLKPSEVECIEAANRESYKLQQALDIISASVYKYPWVHCNDTSYNYSTCSSDVFDLH